MNEEAETIREIQRSGERTTPKITLERLEQTYQMMKANKPNDRSEQDRYWAIAITDMEKLIAFFKVYVAKDS